MPESKPAQARHLDTGSTQHRVEVTPAGLSRRLAWAVDGRLLAERKSSDGSVVLTPDPDPDPDGDRFGAVRLTFSTLGRSRRVTWFETGDHLPASAVARVGIGGLDFDPEPGSPAAIRDARARPRLHALRHVAGGVAKVVVPLLVAVLLARFAVRIPWPEVDLPLPDLPRLPWPEVPWPDWSLPDWSLPGWLAWVLSHAKYVVPILIGIALARNEVQRRQRQDALKAELKAQREQD